MNTQTAASSAAPAAAASTKAALKRTLVGRVVSDKMDKTVTVLVERRVKHPTIGKYVTRSKKFHAHSEANEFKLGDLVEIGETSPISKTKAWKVVRLLEKSKLV
jgi:small subunit ribosomal protein S17